MCSCVYKLDRSMSCPLHKLRLLHRFCRAGIHSGSSEDEDVNILGVPSEVVSSDPEESHGSVRSGS